VRSLGQLPSPEPMLDEDLRFLEASRPVEATDDDLLPAVALGKLTSE